MKGRQVALYFAWSRADETAAPLGILEDRFPALFELRRLFWPRHEHLADPATYDQGIAGFLDHIQKANFEMFAQLTASWTGNPVRVVERKTDQGVCVLDEAFLAGIDTLIIISFDSSRTGQRAEDREVGALRAFLEDPDHTVFVCPHHDIGNTDALQVEQALPQREAEFHHHGDPAIPSRQCFGDFGISLLDGLGVPARNRFGLRPARLADGAPAPLDIAGDLDRAGFLAGVTAFNLHAHLPHFERRGDGLTKLDVLARQAIDLTAPPHPFTDGGRHHLDALLQSKPDVFAGRLLICDTTLWSSTAGGIDGLKQFWRNVVTFERSS